MNYKKILLTSFIFYLFVPKLFTQDDRSVFDNFTGVWEGTYLAGEYKNNETMTNKWVLNDKFFQMDILGSMADDPSSKYSSTAFFTLDDNDNVVGWLFSDNGYSGIVTYKGKLKDGKIVLDGKNPDYTVKQTYEIKDGKLMNKREYKYKGKDPIIIDVVFTKKK